MSVENLGDIKCDRCGGLADFYGEGGHCPECDGDLCIRCAGSWTELAADDEPGYAVCDTCLKAIKEKPYAKNAIQPSFDRILCNLCGQTLTVTTGDHCVFVAHSEPDTIRICGQCRENESIDLHIRQCPDCNRLVYVWVIENSGNCPVCGFSEDEHGGSSWI